MKDLLFSTTDNWAGFVLRLTLGLIMFPHGAQKMLGMFGGYGYKETVAYFTETMKIPYVIAFLVIIIEFVGSIGLLVGFSSRLWSAAFIAVMLGAIITTNYTHGFFMNWFGNQQGEGYEYHLLVIGISLALLIIGSGKYSVDSFL